MHLFFFPQELFLRGNVDLSRAMGRVKVKGTRHKGANNPDDEPDFFSYPALDEEAEKEKSKLLPQDEAASVATASMSVDPISLSVSLGSTERTARGSFDENAAINSLLKETFCGSPIKSPADPVPTLPDDINDIFLDTDHRQYGLQ